MRWDSRQHRRSVLPLLFAAAAPALADGDWSQYEATVRAASASPPWNGPTEPAIAPKGKYLVGVSCTWTLAGCKLLAQGVETAASRLGWRSKTIVVNDPNGYDQALQTAINSGADGIVLTGVDQNLIPGGPNSPRRRRYRSSASSSTTRGAISESQPTSILTPARSASIWPTPPS